MPTIVPQGFSAGTVAGRSLRHLVPTGGRFGICGAPVASLVAALGESDRLCGHCVDRAEWWKSPSSSRACALPILRRGRP